MTRRIETNLLNIQADKTANSLSTRTPEFAPSILLLNVMSLAPKIDEIRLFTPQRNFDLIFLTETWLRDSVGDNIVALPNYNLIRRDRTSGVHGGVCLYSKDSINIKRLYALEDPSFEVLWIHTRPRRLPKGIPGVVTATVTYHPPSANNNDMLEYLSNSLTQVEGLFPDCGFITFSLLLHSVSPNQVLWHRR